MIMVMMMTEQISQLCHLLTQKEHFNFPAYLERQSFHQNQVEVVVV